jgi:signal transduction histidine kinase
MLREAQERVDALAAAGQAKYDEAESAAIRQSNEILAKAKAKADSIKKTAVLYRDHILKSVENEKRIVTELNKQMAKLRTGWLASQTEISELVASVGDEFVKLESDVSDVTREIANKRGELTDVLASMTADIRDESEK